MSTKHTPGPWKYLPDAWIIADVGSVVLTSQGMEKADARLIAAAPDMLAALRELVEDYEAAYGGNDEDAPKALTQARAAIAKAGAA
jgi:hypothetical protein